MSSAATPTGIPRFFVVDPDTAQPVPGGLVYTYAAGTTSPKGTWTSAAKSVPLSNPVVMDADGGKNIYIDGEYKFVVHDAADNLLYTIDNIIGGSASFDRPASGVDFLPYSYVTATDVQNAIEQVVDGTFPDTAVIPIASGGTAGTTEATAKANLNLEPGVDWPGFDAAQALGSAGGTRTIDLTSTPLASVKGHVVSATVSTSANTFAVTNAKTVDSFTLVLTNGGSQTVNWMSGTKWQDGTAPTLTAAGIDVLTFLTTDGGTTWLGFAAGLGMA